MTGPERLRQTIDSARADQRAALLVCLPTIQNASWSLAAARACVAAGADMIEFQTHHPSHPGRVVYELREIAPVLEAPCLVWTDHQTVFNYVLHARGGWRLAPACVEAGVAGLVAPVPPGQGQAFAEACGDGLAPIAFVTPGMQAEHFDESCRATSAFTYAVGAPTHPPNDAQVFEELAGFVERVRLASGGPVVVGAGVTTPAQAALAATFADGVAVAKAVFATLREAATRGESQIDALASLVNTLRGAVQRERGARTADAQPDHTA